MRQRAEVLAHIQNTKSPYNLPAIGEKIASKANRAGGAERLPEPAVPKSIDVALALIGHDDALLRDMALSVLTTATPHEASTLDRRRTVLGSRAILRLVRLSEIHDMQRFPRVRACVSSCRLVKCAKASVGKRYGTSGTKSGHAYLTGAFSEAAVLLLRAPPAGQQYLTRWENKHFKGKALTVLAHKFARAV